MELEKRWNELWSRLGGKTSGEKEYKELYNELVSLYNESYRAYHNLEHIKNSLKGIDEIHDYLNDPLEVEIAIWYHDSIYNPKRNDNEEKSAELAEKRLSKAGLEKSLINNIKSMILATKFKETSENNKDCLYLLDIDFSILGQSPEVFDKYENDIRSEYSHLSEKEFKKRRKNILEIFLKRPNIYSTEYFRKKYEKQARKNLENSIKKLNQ